MADTLMNASDGIWNHYHTIVEFETAGPKYAALELGDWIQLDSNTVDSQFRQLGGRAVGWSGRDLIVIGLNKKMDATWIKALELWP
jgi:hypothetical protein